MKKELSHVLVDVEPEETIPKIIHQTFGRKSMPETLRRNVEEIKDKNPTWDYRFYDDEAIESFISEYYGQKVLDSYRRIDPSYGAARADLFRYLVMYRVGGVYLDIKSRFLVPIDDVIKGDESYIVSQWSNKKGEKYEGFGLKPEVAHVAGGELQQWHIIAAPGHPFLRALLLSILDGIDRYRPWRHGTGKVGVMRLTGPLIYTLTLMPLLESHKCKIVPNESALFLDYSALPGDGHKRLFGQHYSENERSIVQLPRRLFALHVAYRAGRFIRKKLGI